MSEGLAKSADVAVKPELKIEHREIQTAPMTTYDSVPIDVMRMFDADFNTPKKTMESLKMIADWALGDTETIGDAMQKIRNVERKIGMPQNGETRITKFHNWVRMERTIQDLRKRQEALSVRN